MADKLILDDTGLPMLLVTLADVRSWREEKTPCTVAYQLLSVSPEGETCYRAIYTPKDGVPHVLVNDNPFEGVEVTVLVGYMAVFRLHAEYGDGGPVRYLPRPTPVGEKPD